MPEMGITYTYTDPHFSLLAFPFLLAPTPLQALEVTFTQLIWHTAEMGNAKSRRRPKNQTRYHWQYRVESHFAWLGNWIRQRTQRVWSHRAGWTGWSRSRGDFSSGSGQNEKKTPKRRHTSKVSRQ